MAAAAVKLLRIVLRDMLVYRTTLVLIVTPIALLPLAITYHTQSAYCAYVLLLMAVYWLTSAIPIAVTALLPAVLFPLLGIMDAKSVARNYFTDTSMMVLGALMIALAVEKSMLHKRVALRFLLYLGCKPNGILIGMMAQTWFISMWISNLATTAMMLPTADAIIEQLTANVAERINRSSASAAPRKFGDLSDQQLDALSNTALEQKNQHQATSADCSAIDMRAVDTATEHEDRMAVSYCQETPLNGRSFVHSITSCKSSQELTPTIRIIPTISADVTTANTAIVDSGFVGAEGNRLKPDLTVEGAELQAKLANFSKMLRLAIAYSASVGGTATLTGTATNLAFHKIIDDLYTEHGLPSPITYTSWLMFGVPHAVLCIIYVWFWLQFFFMGSRSLCFCGCVRYDNVFGDFSGHDIIRKEYDKLGPMTFAEKSTLLAFIIVVALWLTRDPGFVPGYGDLFQPNYVTDALPALAVALLLFVCPSQVPRWLCFRSKTEPKARPVPTLLDWDLVSSKMAWGPIILLGGGFALAEGCNNSGLSSHIGSQLQILSELPGWLMVLIIVTCIATLTEITSNTAVVTVVCPILNKMAEKINVNPLYVSLPATMAASYAFMLPVATPVNALLFSHGNLRLLDMVKAGAALNVGCILIVTAAIHVIGRYVFNLDQMPAWYSSYNNSTAAMTAAVAEMDA